MNEKLIERVRTALDRRDIPKWIQLQVFNAICGPDTVDPPQLAWKALRAEVQAHIDSMRSNKGKTPPALRAVRAEYYEVVVDVNERIRTYPDYVPIPPGKERWQEWVLKDKREALSARFRSAYKEHSVRGKRLIPFAPAAYRAANLDRLDRCEAAIALHRAKHDPLEKGKGDTPLDALMLCACRMAERAIHQYRKDLEDGTAHPYETPAKVNWQHYCTQAMRARVRDAISGQPISLEGLTSFYDGEA